MRSGQGLELLIYSKTVVADEGADMRCWEVLGCKGSMAPDCPHDATGICPRTCINTVHCGLPWYERASGMEMFDAYDVDFKAARKENCQNCRFFLERAPRIAIVEK